MKEMKTILFQGDSITDAGRNKEASQDLGGGYPCLVGAKLGRRYPEKYRFLNRGIGGNKVTDLIGRWKRDCINLQPDYLSILVGVNDVWHELDWREGTAGGAISSAHRSAAGHFQQRPEGGARAVLDRGGDPPHEGRTSDHMRRVDRGI